MNDNDLLKAAHRYLLHNEAVSGADELVQQLVDALDEAIKRGDQYHEENDQLFKRAVEAEENGRHAQRAPVTDAMVERAWAAIVGRDIAPQCFNASIIRADLRTGLEAALSSTECVSPMENNMNHLTEDQIKHMVNRFLGWRLPQNFNPDAGISYTRPNYAPSVDATPSGTNLFDATQADAMVRHMIEGLPAALPSTDGCPK